MISHLVVVVINSSSIVSMQELQAFEASIESVEELIGPLAVFLEKKPSDRSHREVRKIVPLISRIKAFSGLDEQV